MTIEQEVIRSSPYFSGLDEETIERFRACAEHETHEAGTLIYTEMAVEDDIYLLIEGQVELAVKMASQAYTARPHVVGPGSLLGVHTLIIEGPRLFTATALTPVALLHWKAAACEAIVREDPAAGLYILRQLAKELFLFIRREREEVLDHLEWGLE